MTSNDKNHDAPSALSSTTSNYSTTERNCKTVPVPPSHRLDIEDIYSDRNDQPNLDILKQHLLLEGRLTEEAALRIIETGKMNNSFFLKLYNIICHQIIDGIQ